MPIYEFIIKRPLILVGFLLVGLGIILYLLGQATVQKLLYIIAILVFLIIIAFSALVTYMNYKESKRPIDVFVVPLFFSVFFICTTLILVLFFLLFKTVYISYVEPELNNINFPLAIFALGISLYYFFVVQFSTDRKLDLILSSLDDNNQLKKNESRNHNFGHRKENLFKLTWIKKYFVSVWLGIVLSELLTLSYFVFNGLNPTISSIIGLLFALPISLFWLEYNRPVLKINSETEERFGTLITGRNDSKFIRIIIENKGRSAAKGCKGYVITNGCKERVCWMIPVERPSATINVDDSERLDFCAFYWVGNHTIAFPTENGWNETRPPTSIDRCKVLITSENAEPVAKNIEIDYNQQKIKILDITCTV